jgi:ubiquinol-cytochrome c reductase iron-sulfur subunit
MQRIGGFASRLGSLAASQGVPKVSTLGASSAHAVPVRGLASKVAVAGNHDSPDTNFVSHRLPAGDGDSKRAFTYFMLGNGKILYASAARLLVVKAIATLSASADVLAMANLEVDLSSIQPGQCVTVKWRGKPVFIKNRTEEQIAEVAAPVSDLRHNQTDAERTQVPKWYVWRRDFLHVQGCVCPCGLFPAND